jgi:hypothetical protein
MATLKQYKEVRSWGPEAEAIEIVYDFAKDGGATGSLDVIKVKDACVVRAAYYNVETACTSGGSATVALGVSGGAELVAATAVASLTAGASIDGASIGTTFKLAADAIVQLTIATAALTAGKIKLRMEIAKF